MLVGVELVVQHTRWEATVSRPLDGWHLLRSTDFSIYEMAEKAVAIYSSKSVRSSLRSDLCTVCTWASSSEFLIFRVQGEQQLWEQRPVLGFSEGLRYQRSSRAFSSSYIILTVRQCLHPERRVNIWGSEAEMVEGSLEPEK